MSHPCALVDACAVLQQHVHNPSVGCHMQRALQVSVAVGVDARRRAEGEEQPHHLAVPALCRVMQRREPLDVALVHLRPALQQRNHHALVPLLCGQRKRFVVHDPVRSRDGADQIRPPTQCCSANRRLNSRPADVTDFRRRRPSTSEGFGGFMMTVDDGKMKRLEASVVIQDVNFRPGFDQGVNDCRMARLCSLMHQRSSSFAEAVLRVDVEGRMGRGRL
mmetsp:Transcript_41344/g.82780  ORF Transcript_41344/g.82780 Transcript_41344/m.82780 type:complete len:220 (+) Transcript_41344:320-979(+)